MVGAFPFKLENLESWTIKRTDGTVTKFTLTTVKVPKGASQRDITEAESNATSWFAKPMSLSTYCNHIPKTPTFYIGAKERAERTGLSSPLGLYVGSISSKNVKDDFDFIIDGGGVIATYDLSDNILEGDEQLVEMLREHTTFTPAVRVLKVDWLDRKAPRLAPSFWTALNEQVHGDVMTCCQGGHGRSGTAFACLLLCNAPDYDALDAIIHLRAVHCARAIESAEQHDYINTVAEFLGRQGNARELGEVHDYKAAFRAMTKPTALMTKQQLEWA